MCFNRGTLLCNGRRCNVPKLRRDDRNRWELVENESKTSLRSTVVYALLEYRRTCGKNDADALQVGMGMSSWSTTIVFLVKSFRSSSALEIMTEFILSC